MWGQFLFIFTATCTMIAAVGRGSGLRYSALSNRLSVTSFVPSRRRERPVVRPSSSSTTRMAASYPALEGRNLVSVQDCLGAFSADDGGIVFVDGSWYHRSERNGRAEFEAGPRIRGARYVDMDDIAARGADLNPKDLPHMIPPPGLFAAAMDEMGIRNSDHVVVYGKEGCVFTPRTFFLFQQMGHNHIHLLQGSFEEWADAGGAIETHPTTVIEAKDLDLSKEPTYQARDAPSIVNMEQMLKAVEGQGKGCDDDAVIIDPRGTTFAAGHMPGAINIPYRTIVTDNDLLKFKSQEELLAICNDAGVDVNTEKKIICTCGSGVSVCHIVLALQEYGRDISAKTYIYDGSWSEWGADDNTPKVSSQ